MRSTDRAACARAEKNRTKWNLGHHAVAAYFGLPGWVTDEGAAAALSGGATRGEKKRFSISPKSNAAEASTKIRPLVIVGLVAGCADEAL